jgi:NTE family protein
MSSLEPDLLEVPLPMPRAPYRPNVKRISLALQGGGAHGAFTWGVLHRLMSEPRLYIDGISGASAGAMNGIVLVDGFLKGKRQGAIDAMAQFWDRVGHLATVPRSPLPRLLGLAPDWRVENEPAFLWMDFITRIFSPAELNPLDYNPLRDILAETVDFEAIRQHPFIKLFIAASNVRTCKPRIFRTPELQVDCVMASACLPLMFRAVEIEGEHYWDGGYLGNPAIYPLIHECGSSDIVIVRINPMNRDEVPTTAHDIMNRINEMSFNASLVREMRSIATMSRLVQTGALDDDRYTTVRFHEITAEADLAALGALSKLNTEPAFLKYLHDLGFDTADRWVAQSFDQLGWESTIDLVEKFT